LFANGHDAKNLTWHPYDRKVMDFSDLRPILCNGRQLIFYIHILGTSQETNLRLGLTSDGMNPFGNLSTNHSSCSVSLMIYNLPPWLCIKRKYIILCMMIVGPRQPGNNIDVYLTQLIEDLRKLWKYGVDVWDGNLQQGFRLRAMVFCTINDFLVYENLSGYSVKGHHTCPICEKNTSFIQLKHRKKTIYTRHRRFLKPYHPYRRLKKAFNGS